MNFSEVEITLFSFKLFTKYRIVSFLYDSFLKLDIVFIKLANVLFKKTVSDFSHIFNHILLNVYASKTSRKINSQLIFYQIMS